jgi:hypothetical protein
LIEACQILPDVLGAGLPRSNGSVRFQKSRSTGLSRWQSANYGALGDTRITATVNDTLLTAVTADNRTAANFANNSGPRLESQHAPDSNSAHFIVLDTPAERPPASFRPSKLASRTLYAFRSRTRHGFKHSWGIS